MEEIKAPKKERKFLKAVGNIAKVLANELVMGIARKFIGKAIDKVGNKRQGLMIAFVILASTFAIAQYPATGNKQRLGYQTTGDGLVFRGRSNDTMALKPSTLNNAYHLFDTVNNVLFSYIKTKGGWQFNNSDTVIVNNNFSQPVDSLFFNVGVPTNNVDTAKMRWDSDLATVVLGLNDNVPNELGFKNFWLVKNQTGSTITKGSLVYANGTLGASGRITVAKFIANGSIDAKYLLGITAHDLSNGEDGYVISFGKIRKVNTDTFAAGAILYPSPTVAGVWTDVEPVAPNIDMPIGFCINSHVNNGTISIRVASGYALHELHDLAITSPSANASLYYKSGLWRDTTAALLTSDTASMLTPYFRDADTTSLNLVSRFAAKLNISDTSSMLTNYLRTGVAASTYLTQSSAASTYLPLTGGILTGGLKGIDSISLINNDGGTSVLSINVNRTGTFNRIFLVRNTGSGSNDGLLQLFDNGITKVNIAANNSRGGNTYFNGGGNFGIGTTTPNSTFEVHGSAVFNEGSSNYDFRVESNNNANMFFVDALNDRIGINTNTPSKTLDVNGEVRIATVTATPTALLGKDGSNVVGEVALGTGMSVSGGILSVQAAGASATGLVTSFGSQTFGGNKTFNGTVTFEGNAFFKKNIELPIVKINNTDYTATTSNNTIIYTILTADKTLTIPNAADAVGMKYIISIFDIPEGNEALTLVTPSSNLFVRTDGESSNVDIVGGYCTTIQSDGTKWYILSYAPMY
jgi:hypothetical protein